MNWKANLVPSKVDWLPYDSVCLSSGFLQGWRSGGWTATFPSPILPSRWRSTSMENGLKSLAVEWWSSSLSIQVGKNPYYIYRFPGGPALSPVTSPHLHNHLQLCHQGQHHQPLQECPGDPCLMLCSSLLILQICLIFGYPPRHLLAARFGLRIL